MVENIENKAELLIDSEGTIIEEKPKASMVLLEEGNDIIDKIIVENDPNKLDNLTKLFTLNQKKKQFVRLNKLSELLNKIDGEVIDRFESHPEAIEDRDLYRYWQTTSDIVANKREDDLTMPRVQINNQTNINVNQAPSLNRESRARVLEVVSQILGEAKKDVIDVNVNGEDRNDIEEV